MTALDPCILFTRACIASEDKFLFDVDVIVQSGIITRIEDHDPTRVNSFDLSIPCQDFILFPGFINTFVDLGVVPQALLGSLLFQGLACGTTLFCIKANEDQLSQLDMHHTLKKIILPLLHAESQFSTNNPMKSSMNQWSLFMHSIHQENSELEKRKLAWSCYQSVTTKAASCMGLQGVGKIHQGYQANLFMFKYNWVENPSLDMLDIMNRMPSLNSFMECIQGVMHHGTFVYGRPWNMYRNMSFALNRKDNQSHNPMFDTIESAIEDFKMGKFLVVVDDEDRENEGDLIIAAQDLTEEKAAFMIRYTSGVICVPATQKRLNELGLDMMVEQNTDSMKTAYTITTDYKHGTTTGISAFDRSLTIRELANPKSKRQDFNRPGHVFPLRYTKGGVLQRMGHTEAGVDLCRLCNKEPVAAISEIILDNGKMARRDDLIHFAQKWNLKMITIHDLKNYRQLHPFSEDSGC